MNAHQVTALLVRLFAVGLAIFTLRITSEEIAVYWEYQAGAALPYYLPIVLGLTLLACALLWKFPLFIARKLLGPVDVETGHDPLSAHRAYTIGFVILGMLLLFFTLSDVVYWAVYWVRLRNSEYFSAELDPAQVAAIATTAVELVMALYLVLGARSLSRVFLKFRYGS